MSVKTERVLSGMRPTGRLHFGHYHGVLKNWVELQLQYECYFSVVDWHALTTHYENPSLMEENVWEMVIDWLAAGVNPNSACLFIQSKVPEHAELHLLLSMMTPLSWLERVPTYKDQQQKLKEKDLSTYGFLGYPVLQTADILAYRAEYVPVGEDQVAHVEISREIARRFNHLYGKETNFAEKVENALRKIGKKNSKIYLNLRKAFQEKGDIESLEAGQALVNNQVNLAMADKERLIGHLEGGGKIILPEPEALLTKNSKLTGLDGQKMSKSYNNTIAMREPVDSIKNKIKTMPTDPARVRRNDPGEPQKCPVWNFHQVYSDESTQKWVQEGCRTAGIGCLDCKKPVIDGIIAEQKPILELAREYENNLSLVKGIVAEGCERARDEARDTLVEVREAMGLNYR